VKGEVFWRRERAASRRLLGSALDAGGRWKVNDDMETKVFSSQAELSLPNLFVADVTAGALPIWLDFSISMDNQIASIRWRMPASYGALPTSFPRKESVGLHAVRESHLAQLGPPYRQIQGLLREGRRHSLRRTFA